jgi:hypothetical protein
LESSEARLDDAWRQRPAPRGPRFRRSEDRASRPPRPGNASAAATASPPADVEGCASGRDASASAWHSARDDLSSRRCRGASGARREHQAIEDGQVTANKLVEAAQRALGRTQMGMDRRGADAKLAISHGVLRNTWRAGAQLSISMRRLCAAARPAPQV